MSNFLRDLAIAKFPRFGIVYYIQLDASSEPEIMGGSCRVPLKFYDGKTTPPQHIADKTVKLPLWKWGDFVDIVEAEMWADVQHIVAIELVKRRPDDEYGRLEVQLDKQVTLDANIRDAPTTTTSGPPKPAADATPLSHEHSAVGSERGQPGAGGAPETAAGNPEPSLQVSDSQQVSSPPAAPCQHKREGAVFFADEGAITCGQEKGFYCKDCGERVG